jgi:rhodanese-related sulfurtransferase
MNLDQLLTKDASIVDVRTPGEFMGGNAPGSVNIPLNEIPDRIDELKSMNQPLILCCASGGRSGQATAYLSQQGIDCMNAGSWLDVNYALSLKKSA